MTEIVKKYSNFDIYKQNTGRGNKFKNDGDDLNEVDKLKLKLESLKLNEEA
jgi:hypothetical protein